jgi:choline dehydrogenase
MIYMRGQARDYDQWADITGDARWRWDNALPYFKLHEDHHAGANASHGAKGHKSDVLLADTTVYGETLRHHIAGGEWRVEKQRLRWDVLDAFAQAAVEAGIPATDDFNRGSNEGVGYFEVTKKAAGVGTRPRPLFAPLATHVPTLSCGHLHRWQSWS